MALGIEVKRGSLPWAKVPAAVPKAISSAVRACAGVPVRTERPDAELSVICEAVMAPPLPGGRKLDATFPSAPRGA